MSSCTSDTTTPALDMSRGPRPPAATPRGADATRLGVVALVLLAALTLTEAWLSWKNTLHHVGRWTSSKVAVWTGVVNAVSFVVTPRALTGNRLDLGAWLGFEEILSREPAALDELSGRVRLVDGAHVTVLFGVDDTRAFAGVRFSRDPRFPSAIVAGGSDGRFTSRRPIAHAPLGDDWFGFHLRFAHHRVRVSIDGREVADLPATGREGRFGFHSGRRSVLIDSVDAAGHRSGRPVRVVEGFRNDVGWVQALALTLGALATLGALTAALASARRRSLRLLQYGLTACLFGASALWVLEPRLAEVHPQQGPVLNAIALREGFRSSAEFEGDVLRRLRAEPPADGTIRAVFLGSSQTAGVGAYRREDAFVARLDVRLRARRSPDAPPLRVVNAAVVGDRSESLVARYITEIDLLRPTLVVVNLGNTDRDSEELGRHLERLAVFNDARHIRTMFVVQPTTLEGPPSRQAPDDLQVRETNRDAIREVAARHGATVVELPRELAPHQDDGFVWWDEVHLTSFGQSLVADALLPYLEREVSLAEHPAGRPVAPGGHS